MDEPKRYRVLLEVEVALTVSDPDVISRCVDNHDRWRETFYDLDTEEKVVEHLAFNLGLNGRPLAMLDGWADLNAEAAEADINGVDVLQVEVLYA